MMVAGFIVHLSDPFDKKELAILYALIFLLFTVYRRRKVQLRPLIEKETLKVLNPYL